MPGSMHKRMEVQIHYMKHIPATCSNEAESPTPHAKYGATNRFKIRRQSNSTTQFK